jgi:DNA-directed RNA polymerase subunit M/transcription elongation factor TFIIS
MFCKTCGTLLIPKSTSYGKWMSCRNGHSQPELNQESKEIVTENLQKGKVIQAHDGINHLAVYDHKCQKCGYDKCELIEKGAWYSDEDNTYQMKCGKCGSIEQLEGKTT